MDQRSILDISYEELENILTEEFSCKKFRAKQIWDWLYVKRVTDFSQMKNISKDLQDKLSFKFSFFLPRILDQKNSSDGSIKLLLEYNSNSSVECVIMPFSDRVSLCVSTQIGCAVGCSFCYTATMGFSSNLDYTQILTQFLIANRISETQLKKKISHVVFMGMGEPFLNYNNTLKALEKLTSKNYYGLSTRSITVSTSGIVDKISSFARDTKCGLAISLGSAVDEKRTRLMPINKTYNLSRLKEALLEYQRISSKVITVEYILIHGLNTSIKDAKELVKFLTFLKVKVNLIPLNASPNPKYLPPTEEEIRDFQAYLVSKRIAAPVRYSRATDIYGACGQLRTCKN